MVNFAVLLRCFLGALLLLASSTSAHESCCKLKLNELVGSANEFIEDPDDVNPPAVDGAGHRRWIPDPEDFKPSYWDDEDDGPWEPRELLNPQYDWSPRLIPNPLYLPPPTYCEKLFVEVNAALPWITLGVILTGALTSLMTLLPPAQEIFSFLKKSGGREGDDVFAVAAAAILGLATPLCSCGAIPLAASFVTSGIPLSSTMAFLTASQSAGLDSAAITWGLLGPMAVVCRLGGAILLAVAAGLVCSKTATKTDEHLSEGGDCCASKKDSTSSSSSSSTCGTVKKPQGGGSTSHESSSSLSRLWLSLSDTAVEILPTVFTGLALSTAALHFFPSFLTIYSSGESSSFLVRSLLLLAAMPMQLCEHSTVTLAAAIQKAGGSPGLSFSFLLAAPATNMPTLLMLLRYGGEGRGRIVTAAGVVMAIAGTALAMSYAVDGAGLDLLVDKDPNSQMADLPGWYVGIVPYLVSSLFCTGALRQVLKYVDNASTKNEGGTQKDSCCATTTEKAKSD